MNVEDSKSPGFCSHKSRRDLFMTSNKKPGLRLDHSNSQKRRNHEQARLARMKNFPPDFFEGNSHSVTNDIRKLKISLNSSFLA